MTVYSPAVNTYVPIANITLTSSATEILLTGFDTKYNDIVLVATSKSTASLYDQGINFNGDDNDANYKSIAMWGNGTGRGRANLTWHLDYYGSVDTTNTTTTIVQIMDLNSSDKHTTFFSRSTRVASGVDSIAGRWANTDAVTSIKYFLIGGTLDAGSSLKVYGIEA